MAENAAHISFSTQRIPTLFEVIAQESLAELIRPAFKQIVEFWHSRNPNQCPWLYKRFEEIYLVVNTIVQYHYFRLHGGSFAESLYGLKRAVLNSTISDSRVLTPAVHQCLSFLSIVLVPYMKAKGDQMMMNLSLSAESQAYKRNAVFVYKVLLATWQVATFVQYILYLSGKSQSHSLVLKLLGIYLCYKTEQDYKQELANRRCAVWPVFLQNAASYGLETFAFSLQALQWWFTEGTKQTVNSGSLPPPPQQSPSLKVGFDSDGTSACPICKQQLKIETVLLVSGYVFCYRCIWDVLNVEKKCPVTGIPATVDDLIRIYTKQG